MLFVLPLLSFFVFNLKVYKIRAKIALLLVREAEKCCFINVTNFADHFCLLGNFMKDTEVLKEYLSDSRKIVITTHANPDADALGSSLGLFHFLKAKGHEVNVIVPTSYPDFLEWMAGNEFVINYEEDKVKSDGILDSADLLFCLDYSGFNRIKLMQQKVESINSKIALIDHHLNPEINPDFNFWDDNRTATRMARPEQEAATRSGLCVPG